MPVKKRKQGFASMDKKKLKEVASKGGKLAHENGNAHEWDEEEALKAAERRINPCPECAGTLWKTKIKHKEWICRNCGYIRRKD